MTDLNNPDLYNELPEQTKQYLQEWIRLRLTPSKSVGPMTSYGLKHEFESQMEKAYGGDLYVCSGAFKGAMLFAGFNPVNEQDVNWRFKYYYRKTNRKDT